MPPLKNLRQETFCLEYVKDRDSFRSAKAAGYRCGNVNSQAAAGCQVLKSINVKARILELDAQAIKIQEKALVKTAVANIIDRAWVVGKLVENVDRSMQAVAVLDSEGNPTGEWRYEGNVANRGLELIGKDLGMFSEKAEKPGDTYNTIMNFYLPTNDRDVTPEHQPHSLGNGHSSGHTD